MTDNPVNIFISYSHQDEQYLRRDSLVGFLEGLRHTGVQLWTDRAIPAGAKWDDAIREHLGVADIALLLVSQAFLDSDYVRNVELKNIILKREDLVALPVLLSPCNWPEHEWLSRLQFLPRDGKTVEEDFIEPGQRKRLYSQLRTALSREANAIRARRDHEGASKGERRRVTTAYLELTLESDEPLMPDEEAEVIQSITQPFGEAASKIVARYGGQLICRGAEVVYHFGYPRAYENTPMRCVKAVLELSARVEKLPADEDYDVRYGLRGGVDFGRVVVDDSGQLIGKSIDEANRLRLTASGNQVLVSKTVADLVGHQIGVAPLSGGRDFALRAEAREVVSSVRTPALIGRTEELALLTKTLPSASRGEGTVVLIRGERGIGKTRLLDTLKAHGGWRGRTISLGCSPFCANNSLYPVIQYLEHLALEYSTGKTLTRSEAIACALGEAGMDETVSLPAIEPLFQTDFSDEDMKSAGRIRRDLLEALTNWILATTEKQPVLLTLEDAEWADPSTLELLSMLLDYIQDTPLMLVMTASKSVSLNLDGVRSVEVGLTKLSSEEVASMISALDETQGISKDYYTHIAYATDGIPLFIEEYVDMMLKEAARPRAKATSLVPIGLDGLLTQRLDQLGSSKIGAQLAAVIGDEFDEDFYCIMAEKIDLRDPLGKIRDCLASGALRRSGRPGQKRYRFRHGLLRDAAYGTIIRRDRKHYHRIAAEVMASQHLDETEPASMALHLLESGQAAKAVPYLHRSAKRHMTKSENREAEQDLARALELLSKLPEDDAREDTELSLRLDMGAILVALKGYGAPEMETTYERAHALGINVGDPARLFSALWGAWAYRIVRGSFDAAQALSNEIEALTLKSGSNTQRIDGYHVVGVTHFNCGRFREAVAAFDQGLDIFENSDPSTDVLSQGQDAVVALYCWKGVCLSYMGEFESADLAIDAALRRAETLNHRLTEVFAHTFFAIAKDMQHQFEVAVQHASGAGRLSEVETFTYWQAWNDFIQGSAESALQVTKTSLDKTRAAIQAYESTGARVWLPYMQSRLARDLSSAGQSEAAEAMLAGVKALSDDDTDRYYAACIRCFEAEILLDQGSEPDATACLKAAFEIAVQQSHLMAMARILALGRRLSREEGRAEAARWQARLQREVVIPASSAHLF